MFLNLLYTFELYISYTVWIMLLKKLHSQQKYDYFLTRREKQKNADLHFYVAHSWPLKLEELRSMMTLYTQWMRENKHLPAVLEDR